VTASVVLWCGAIRRSRRPFRIRRRTRCSDRRASGRQSKEDPVLTRKTTAKKSAPRKQASLREAEEPPLLSRILNSLDDDKAENIVTIDLDGRSALADAIVIATGRSARHVSSIAEHLGRRLKEAGYGTRPLLGVQTGDWALVDAGDVIVHVFRPEVRLYYDLEGMWSIQEPERAAAR
jgi:ribosome-associated protein